MSRRRRVLLLALCAAALGIGACGSDAPDGAEQQRAGERTPGAGQPPGAEQAQAFTDCLRDEGVELPDETPRQGGGGGAPRFDPQDPDVRAALEACRGELPEGAGPGGGGFGAPPGGDGAAPPDESESQ